MTMSILVVSHSPDVTRRLRAAMEPHGYSLAEIPAQATAEEVLQTIACDTPDMVVLSPGTVNLEGRYYDIVERLGDKNPDRPRTMMLVGPGTRGGCTGVHAYTDMHISDPFSPKELLLFVHRLIGPSEE